MCIGMMIVDVVGGFMFLMLLRVMWVEILLMFCKSVTSTVSSTESLSRVRYKSLEF